MMVLFTSVGAPGNSMAERFANTDISTDLLAGLPVVTSSHESCSIMHTHLDAHIFYQSIQSYLDQSNGIDVHGRVNTMN